MADTRISALTRLPEAGVSPTDLLPIADLSASETKAITAKDLLEGVVINMDAGSIPASKINFTAGGGLHASVIGVTKGDVVLGRIGAAGPAEEIACTSAGRALLSAATAGDQRNTLQLGTLATRSGSWVDGSSFSGTSSGTNTGDQTITLTGPVTGTGRGTFATKITDGAVGSTQIAVGGVATANVANDAITAAKLADQSAALVGPGAPAGAGAFVGQGAFSTATGLSYTYTGSSWVQHAGVQTISLADANTPLTFQVSGTASTVVSVDLDVQAPNTVWAGPLNGLSGKPAFRALIGEDLPAATSATRGAIVPGAGLGVAAGGALSITTATAAAIGGVSVPGPDLQITAAGALSHPDSAAPAGTYAKVTTDAKGHVTGGATQIGDADIASLDASKLNTGVLNAARLGDRSISGKKLDNYAISYIQESTPSSAPSENHVGQLWYQESTAQLRMWNGNSWMNVGSLGRLGTENMRFCGTWNATTHVFDVLTSFGVAAGLTTGGAIPSPTDALTGVYLVATTPGTYNTNPYDNGDWLLCLGASAGWVRVDTLSSAGSSTIRLKDLLDVTIPTPGTGDALIFDGTTNRWVNRPTSGVKSHLTPAFDGIRTSFTLAHDAPNVNAVLLSLGGVVQNPGTDFTLTGSRVINFAAPPPVGLDYWVLLEGMPSTSGGGGTSLPPGTGDEEYLRWNSTLGSWQPSSTLNGGQF